MSRARIYVRNLIANWTGPAVNLTVLFFLSPFVVHTLGETQYGIWSLLMVLTGYMGLFDLGVRASTGRYVILYYGRGDHERLQETLRTGFGFFSAAGLLILLAGVVIGLAFPTFFPSAPAEYQGLVVFLLPILAVNIWLSVIGALYASMLAAQDRFDLMQVVGVTSVAVRAVGTVLVLRWGYGIVGLTVVTLADGVLSAVGNRWLARRIYPRLRAWPPLLSRERLRELFGYGLPAFLSGIAGRLVSHSAMLVTGVLISVAAVTTYSIGSMLVFYAGPFLWQVTGTLFPSVQRSVAQGDMGSVRWLYLRQMRAGLVVGVLVYGGFILFGKLFIRTWMGPEFTEAFTVMAILSAMELLTLFSGGAASVLSATGHVWFLTAVGACEGIVSLSLAVFFVLVLGWGIVGIAAAALAARVLVSLFTITWRVCSVIELRWTSLTGVAVPGLLTAAAFVAWGLLIRSLIPAQGWGLFFTQVALACAGYAPIAMAMLVPKDDRMRVFRFLRLVPASRG
jgi:O-antigen/teichoic acid export membrane protein